MREYKLALKENFLYIFKFELMYRLIALGVLIPLIKFMISIFMEGLGYRYITFNILVAKFKNPLFIILTVFIMLIFAFFILIEVSSALNIFYVKDKSISMRDIFVMSIKNIKLSIRNLWIFLIAIIMGGLTYFDSAFIYKMKIPSFVLDAIYDNIWYASIYIFIRSIFIMITLFFIYIFNAYFIDKLNMKQAIAKSIAVAKKNYIKIALTVLVVHVSVNVLYLVFNYIFINIVSLFDGVENIYILYSIYGIYRLILIVMNFLKIVLIITLLRVLLNVHYKTDKEIVFEQYYFKRTKFYIKRFIIWSIVLANVLYSSYIVYSNKSYSAVRKVEITAHRGGGDFTPENTLESIKEGSRVRVDFAEIDVQLTKDGECILLHDKSFKRLFGVNKKPIDMTLEEIKDLDFLDKYKKNITHNAKIPTLDEAIKEAKKLDIKLNIEIKANDKLVIALTKKVIHDIWRNNFSDRCVISSLNYTALEEVKRLDKSIRTGYIAPFVKGDIKYLRHADFLSVEVMNVSKKFVENAHNLGKSIHVWTVNDSDDADRMLESGVDNIITDKMEMVFFRGILFNKVGKSFKIFMDYME